MSVVKKRSPKRQKICRSLGVSLWGKKIRKNYPPGVHGPRSSYNKLTDYGSQLRAKRILQEYYNLKDYQLRNLHAKASKKKGDTAQILTALLEASAKVLVYRARMAPSIQSARQLVSHKHFMINGKTVNIHTHIIKPGDVISVRDRSKQKSIIADAIKSGEFVVPPYIELSSDGMSAKFLREPSMEEVPYPFTPEMNSVIEYYNK